MVTIVSSRPPDDGLPILRLTKIDFGGAMNDLWLDVSMWQPLRGTLHPISEIECETPDPLPEGFHEWHDWAETCLLEVARRDRWQPGRYFFTILERDRTGAGVRELGNDFWDYEPSTR